MKMLTIVRHAKSSWNEPGLSDRERPLNKRGQHDAPRMGKCIADAGIRPSLIVSSPATRAWTTAQIIAEELSYPVESKTSCTRTSATVDMTLTAPGCGMGEILVQDAQEKIAVIPTVADVRVQLVFDPPWNQSMMSDEARLQTGLM